MSDSDSSSSIEQAPVRRPRIKPQKLTGKRRAELPEAGTGETSRDAEMDAFFRRGNSTFVSRQQEKGGAEYVSDSDDDVILQDIKPQPDETDQLALPVNSNNNGRETVNLSSDEEGDGAERHEYAISDRSASLTPPPELPEGIITLVHRQMRSRRATDDQANTNMLLQLDMDNSTAAIELDPELQEIASNAPRQFSAYASQHAGQSADAPRHRINVCILTIRHPQLPVTTENALALAEFERPLNFVMLYTEPFETLLSAYCQQKQLSMANVVFVHQGVRLFPRGTPQSLEMPDNVELDAFTLDAYQYVSAERELSRKRKLADLGLAESEAPPTPGQGAAADVAMLHLRIRDKSGHDERIRVRTTVTIGTIITQYAQLRKLASSTTVQLEFDGERLAPGTCIGDIDIEDDEMLTAILTEAA